MLSFNVNSCPRKNENNSIFVIQIGSTDRYTYLSCLVWIFTFGFVYPFVTFRSLYTFVFYVILKMILSECTNLQLFRIMCVDCVPKIYWNFLLDIFSQDSNTVFTSTFKKTGLKDFNVSNLNLNCILSSFAFETKHSS